MVASLCLVLIQFISIFVALCAIANGKAMQPRPHRYHNRIFHPNKVEDPHRARRDDDCQDEEWETMTFAGRVANGNSDGILQGLVLRLINARNALRPYDGNGMYTAEVRVDCLYSGWGFGGVVNISGFGETNDCVETHVSDGKSYIFLIQTDWFGMAIHEVNDQPGVMETSWETHDEVASVHRCRGPYETTIPPESSYESSDSESVERYSEYSLIKDTSSGSSSFSSSESDDDSCSDCSESASYLELSYYDYDKDGDYDWKKMKNGGELYHPVWSVLIILTITVRVCS